MESMTFFSKKETKALGLILAALVFVSFFNFSASIRKARDAQRGADLSFLREKLEAYQSEVGYFPPATRDGKILACLGNFSSINKEFNRIESPAACRWGEDALINYFSETPKTILEKLPVDPQSEDGTSYVYKSNGSRFQIYASLEGKSEAEYNQKIESLKIKCGQRICNFGRAFGDTPLDKSIEEYENGLLR